MFRLPFLSRRPAPTTDMRELTLRLWQQHDQFFDSAQSLVPAPRLTAEQAQAVLLDVISQTHTSIHHLLRLVASTAAQPSDPTDRMVAMCNASAALQNTLGSLYTAALSTCDDD
ncbi:hypothetical protein ACFV2X_48010 [Streptomyces sp. NPDC059679]|uniref:hypothetical protein n=1 Tax=Streptomyces sp. NPDC059679 TaxID=3346903 RepID=UPI0036AFAA8D